MFEFRPRVQNDVGAVACIVNPWHVFVIVGILCCCVYAYFSVFTFRNRDKGCGGWSDDLAFPVYAGIP